MEVTRRGLITSAAALLIASPAIVRASSLMHIRPYDAGSIEGSLLHVFDTSNWNGDMLAAVQLRSGRVVGRRLVMRNGIYVPEGIKLVTSMGRKHRVYDEPEDGSFSAPQSFGEVPLS